MEALKKFAFSSTTSNLNERKVLFDDLFSYLKSTDSKGKATTKIKD
jgi:hypothetical protein